MWKYWSGRPASARADSKALRKATTTPILIHSGGSPVAVNILEKPLVRTNLLLKLTLQNRNDCQCLGIGTSLIVINLLTLFHEIVCQYYNAG